jgi:CMP-2-keto-3-deoxyoctulosonic acid synthetase
LPRGVLEERDSLEQLRWLEAGRKMRVVAAARAPRGIDTQDDFEHFAARVRERESAKGGSSRARGEPEMHSQVKAG